MPPRPDLDLPPPDPRWIERILHFANLEDPTELRSPTARDDLDTIQAVNPAGLSDEDFAKHKAAVLSAFAPSWIPIDTGTVAEAPDLFTWTDEQAANSQADLKGLLTRIVRYKKRTRSIDRDLSKAMQDLLVRGPATDPSRRSYSFSRLRQWWGCGLIAYFQYIERLERESPERLEQSTSPKGKREARTDRIRTCLLDECSKFILDWPARRGARTSKRYCCEKHRKTQELRRSRKSKNATEMLKSWERSKK